MHVPTRVTEVLEQCEVCRSSSKPSHAPSAGAFTVAMFNEKLQADLLFSDDAVAARATGVFPKYSFLIPVHANP